jgi:hypothetical protein
MPASSSVTWTKEPNGNSAAAHIVSAPYSDAGIACVFSDNESVVDLSGFDTLEFDAVVPTGTTFTVATGRMENGLWHGCSWNLLGAGATTYTVDLAQPDWCGPTQCAYDLGAVQVSFEAPWGDSTGKTADIEIVDLHLLTRNAGAHVIHRPGSGIGPDGVCWYLHTWGFGTASWVTPLGAYQIALASPGGSWGPATLNASRAYSMGFQVGGQTMDVEVTAVRLASP